MDDDASETALLVIRLSLGRKAACTQGKHTSPHGTAAVICAPANCGDGSHKQAKVTVKRAVAVVCTQANLWQ